MSVQAITWAAEQACGSPVAKLVLLTLADWADQEGVWLLNVTGLAGYCETDEASIEVALSDLSRRGLLWIAGAAIQMAFQSIPPDRQRMARISGTPPWKIARAKRYAIYARDGHACVYCGDTERLSIDHVIPRSKGGGDDATNLVSACQPCNSSKKDRDLSEWRGRQ